MPALDPGAIAALGSNLRAGLVGPAARSGSVQSQSAGWPCDGKAGP